MKNFLLLLFLFSIISLNSQTIIDENFENGLPDGWTLDGGWKLGTTTSLKSDYFNFGDNSTKFIGTNDDAAGANGHGDGKIITDFVDLSSTPNVLLSFSLYYFNANYKSKGQETLEVLYSEDGTTWTKMVGIETFYLWNNYYYDISSFVGGKNVKLAIEYKDGNNWNYGAGVDNFNLSVQPDYFALAFPPSKEFKQIEKRGDVQSFEAKMEYYGKETLKNYKLVYTIDSETEKEIKGNTDLSPNSSYTFEIPGFILGEHTLHSKLVLNDTTEIEIDDKECLIYPPVPNFQRTDVDGKPHDIYAELKAGKKVMIDFFASWCNPCKESTPLISEVWKDHDSSSENFQVYGMTTDRNDDDAKIKGLDWGGEYPAFGYGKENRVFATLYDGKYGENAIPLFVMVCPDKEDPAFSSVSWSQTGYSKNTLKDKIEEAITGCGVAVEKTVEYEKDSILVYTSSEKEPALHIQMKNESDSTKKIYWKIIKSKFNPSWSTQVCDNNGLCYNFNVDVAPKPTIINAGQTEELKLTFYFKDIEDKGELILEIYDNKELTNLVDILPIEINVDFPVATSDLGADKIMIAPNPASEFFKLSTTKGISQIDVYNLVGNKVKSFTNINSRDFDISDLRNGMYMINIIGNQNNSLRVLKLNISKDRP